MNTRTFSITFELELPNNEELDANVENICQNLQETMVCLPSEKILQCIFDKSTYKSTYKLGLIKSGMTIKQAQQNYESLLKCYEEQQKTLYNLWESRKIHITRG